MPIICLQGSDVSRRPKDQRRMVASALPVNSIPSDPSVGAQSMQWIPPACPSQADSRMSLPRSDGPERQITSLPSDRPANMLLRSGTTTWHVRSGPLTQDEDPEERRPRESPRRGADVECRAPAPSPRPRPPSSPRKARPRPCPTSNGNSPRGRSPFFYLKTAVRQRFPVCCPAASARTRVWYMWA